MLLLFWSNSNIPVVGNTDIDLQPIMVAIDNRVPQMQTNGLEKPTISTIYNLTGNGQAQITSAIFQSSSLVYSDSATTYNSSSQVYGGSDRKQDIGPAVQTIDDIRPKMDK